MSGFNIKNTLFWQDEHGRIFSGRKPSYNARLVGIEEVAKQLERSRNTINVNRQNKENVKCLKEV